MACDSAGLLMSDNQAPVAVCEGDVSDEVIARYLRDWHNRVEGNALHRERGIRAWTREEIWPASSWKRSEYYHESCVTAALRLAEALGRNRIERELGAVWMATVYPTHDLRHDLQVALKVLRPVRRTAVC